MKLFVGMAAAALTLCGQDYFPLQKGNQWVYRSSRSEETKTIQVGDSLEFNGKTYFRVTGFSGFTPSAALGRLLRQTEEGALVEWDERFNSERAFLSIQAPEGEIVYSRADECSNASEVIAKDAKVTVPAGTFEKSVELAYREMQCADRGVVTDFFAPNIGLVKRVETTFAGPVTYELVYARVNGVSTTGRTETSFAVSASSPAKIGELMTARLTIQSGGGRTALSLTFPSSQVYNLQLIDSAGEIVYNWSSDKAFLASIQNIVIDGERTWLVQFAVPSGIRPGIYKLEGYLTTAAPQLYRASVALQIVQ
jgi:hypothetical protein